MRSGGRAPASERYRLLIDCVQGIVKTKVNTALNRILVLHVPAKILLGRLAFQMLGLSRRLDRLLATCVRTVWPTVIAGRHSLGLDLCFTPRRPVLAGLQQGSVRDEGGQAPDGAAGQCPANRAGHTTTSRSAGNEA